MKIHRFFVETLIEGKQVEITSEEQARQIKNILRLKIGEKVILFDNSGYDFLSSIDNYGENIVSVTVIDKYKNNVIPARETYLFASLVKKDNFDWIVEKATELGVSEIIPILSKRSEKKDINKARLQKIIVEAAEQSGRGVLPILHEVLDLSEALSKYGYLLSVAWDPFAEKFKQEDLREINGTYIGPEGGWSPDELELFRTHGVHVHSLGPQVLKSETAVIAAISRLVF